MLLTLTSFADERCRTQLKTLCILHVIDRPGLRIGTRLTLWVHFSRYCNQHCLAPSYCVFDQSMSTFTKTHLPHSASSILAGGCQQNPMLGRNVALPPPPLFPLLLPLPQKQRTQHLWVTVLRPRSSPNNTFATASETSHIKKLHCKLRICKVIIQTLTRVPSSPLPLARHLSC